MMHSAFLLPILPLLLGLPAQESVSPGAVVSEPTATDSQTPDAPHAAAQEEQQAIIAQLIFGSPAPPVPPPVVAAVPKEQPATAPTQEVSDDQEKKPGLLERARARREARKPKAPELRRADGSLVEPGAIPQSTSQMARQTWAALKEALATDEAMEAFLLTFNLRQRSLETTQSNDLQLDFAYLAPRFVLAHLESGRRLLRGTEGDFLIDRDEVIKLQGREAAADKKTLDEMAAIAKAFIALTAPSSLRLVDLSMLEAAPSGIHPSYHQEMKDFLWMRVTSPDFFLFTQQKRDGVPVYRADLGIDPKSKAIRFAVISESNLGSNLTPASIFVRMSDHIRREGFFVPHRIEICNLDPTSEPPRFYRRPTSRLDLKRKKGQLRARLSARDFAPPRQ